MRLGFNVTLDRIEALVDIEDAIRFCLEVRAEHGLPLTRETHQVEVAA